MTAIFDLSPAWQVKDRFQFVHIVHAAGKNFATPPAIAIPWIYSPVALELGALSLQQPRHHGEFYLME